MKIVLDTNVLIAAFITRGTSSQLLDHCLRHHELITSEFILGELQEKLVFKFKYSKQDSDEVISLLRERVTAVTPTLFDEPVCRDPDDDHVLGTAVAGNVSCLITGDKDLLVLTQFQGIDILPPSGFAQYEAGHTQYL